MSTEENIRRDYAAHFDFAPDRIYGCDLPEELRKPNTYPLEQICKEYAVSPSEVLVVDDMKFAVEMARSAGTPIAFAGWGRKAFPNICQEMEQLCDFSFYSTEEFKNFLLA
jgi:phosphoglycolate phosphatase-like HAD superfamily hydrolase